MHAGCESLFTEDEVEQAADEGFDCVSCQPYVVKPVGECQLGRAKRTQVCLNLGQCPKLPMICPSSLSTCCSPRIGTCEGKRAR